MKRLALLSAIALLGAACASSSGEDNSVDPGVVSSPTTSAAPSTTAPATGGTTAPATTAAPSGGGETSTPKPEGQPASDFTLALQPAGEFVLSQQVKPVYMVFWAEW